jgi:hypothetical protein
LRRSIFPVRNRLFKSAARDELFGFGEGVLCRQCFALGRDYRIKQEYNADSTRMTIHLVNRPSLQKPGVFPNQNHRYVMHQYHMRISAIAPIAAISDNQVPEPTYSAE